MDLRENMSITPERMPPFVNCFDKYPCTIEPSFLNASIKDEPLDITECSLNELSIKSEPQDFDQWAATNESIISGNITANINNATEKNNVVHTSSILNKNVSLISSSETPVTRKVIINGLTKTCIVVNNPELKQSIMESVEKARKTPSNTPSPIKLRFSKNKINSMVTGPKNSSLSKDALSSKDNIPKKLSKKCIVSPMVICSRCCTEVHIDTFRQHIDACPPRKINSKNHSSNNGVPKAGENQTVQVMYNPSTGEVVTLGETRTKLSCQSSVTNIDCHVSDSNFESNKQVTKNLSTPSKSHQLNVRCQSSSSINSSSSFESSKANANSLSMRKTNLSTTNFQTGSVLQYLLSKNNDNYSRNATQTNAISSYSATHSNTEQNVEKVKERVLSTFYDSEGHHPHLYESNSKSDGTSRNTCPIKLPTLRCVKCNFSSKSLTIIKTHIKNKHCSSVITDTSSTSKHFESIGTKPNNNNGVTDTPNNNTATQNSITSTRSSQKVKLITLWKLGITEACGKTESSQDTKSRKTSVTENDLPNVIISRPMSLKTAEEKTNYICEKLKNTSARNLLTKSKSDQNLFEQITEFKGFNREILTDKNNVEINKLKEAVKAGSENLQRRSKESGNASKPISENLDSARILISPRRTRSKSVCARKIDRKTDEVNSSPPRSIRTRSKSVCARKIDGETDKVNNFPAGSMRTRSKSVCVKEIAAKTDELNISPPSCMRTRSKSFSANKIENVKSTPREISLRRTRSRSVCREKFFSEEQSRDYKRSQSVPRNCQNPKNNRQSRNKDKEVYGSNENVSNVNLKKKSSIRSRSKSVVEEKRDRVHPITYYQNLLKSRSKSVDRSKYFGNINSLDKGDTVINCKNSGKDRKETNKTTIHDSDSNIMSRNSNSESAVDKLEASSVHENSESSQDSESPSNDFLLLKDNTLSCSVCSFTTDKRKVLNDHERNHRKTNLPVFQCNYCSQRYTRYMLYLHVQDVHPGQKFQVLDIEASKGNPKTSLKCSTCSFSTTEPAVLDLHAKKHVLGNVILDDKPSELVVVIPETTFKCSSCSYSSTEQEKLQLHMKRHLFEPVNHIDPTGRQIYDCRQCSYSSSNITHVKRHINAHRKNLPIKNCHKCNFRSTSRALEYHMQKCSKKSKSGSKRNAQSISSKGKVDSKSSVKSFILKSEQVESKLQKNKLLFEPIKRIAASGRQMHGCKMCTYECPSSADICVHINTHKIMPTLKCPNCNFKSTSRALYYHIRKCRKNSKLTSIKNTNGDSKRVNIDQKSLVTFQTKAKSLFKCTKCKFVTSLRIKLKFHIRKHHLKPQKLIEVGSNAQVFNCSRCPFSTNLPVKLKLHQKRCLANTETETKFKCKYCSYVAAKIHHHKQHIKSHTRNLPNRKCPRCSFESNVRILKQHMLESGHTKDSAETRGTKIYKCNFCSFTSSICQSYSSHMRIHAKKVATGLKCKLCSYICNKIDYLKKHMRSHSLKQPIIQCPNCNFRSTVQYFRRHFCDKGNLSRTRKNHSKVLGKNIRSKNGSKDVNPDEKVGTSSINSSKTTNSDTNKSVLKCPHCSFSTFLRTQLNLHLKEYHQNLNRQYFIKVGKHYQCNYCSYASASVFTIKVHMKTHAKLFDKNTTTSSKAIVSTERTSKSNTRRVKLCPDVPIIRNIKAQSRKVSKNRSVSKKFKCDICVFTTLYKQSLKEHMENLHLSHLTIQQVFKQVFKCTTCDFHTLYESKMNLHTENTKHNFFSVPSIQGAENQSNGESYDKTSDSGSKTAKADQNKSRLLDSDKEAMIKNSSGNYACTVCSYTTQRNAKLIRHSKVHQNVTLQLIQCPLCNSKLTPRAMAYHLKKCIQPTCQNKSVSNSEVSPHSTREKALFKCLECSFSSHSPTSIKDHKEKDHSKKKVTKNTGPKRFKCQYCSFASFWTYLLERHMNSHTVLNLPVKQCGKCDFRSTPAALRAHTHLCNGKSQKNGPLNKKRKRPTNEIASSSKFELTLGRVKKRKKMDNKPSREILEINELKESQDKPDDSDTLQVKHGTSQSEISESKNKTDATNGTSDVCEKVYSNNNSSINAVSPNRLPKSVFGCPKCPFSTHLRIKLKFHIQKNHLKRKSVGTVYDKNLKQCEYCSFVASKYALKRHGLTHTVHKKPINKCSNCNFRSTGHALVAHELKCFRNIQ